MEEILAGLNAEFRAQVEELMARLRATGLEPVPTFGVRDPWKQAELWRQSRTSARVAAKIEELRDNGAPYLAQILDEVGPQETDQKVTKAPPGLSWHQWREAVDFGWRSPTTGRILQGGPEDGDEFDYAEECYRKLGQLCGDVGLTWGGTFGDENHVQRPSAGSPLLALSYPQIDARMRELWPNRP